MAEKETTGTSEAEIAVHWGEESYIHPTTEFIAQANMTDEGIYKRFSLENFPTATRNTPTCWTGTSTGTPPRHQRAPAGNGSSGKINASYNCIDRTCEEQEQDRHPFRAEPINEKYETSLPGALRARERFAALLRDFAKLKRGDRLTLQCHVPNYRSPCWPARGGVIHSRCSRFSGRACADRIVDSILQPPCVASSQAG